jgi:hypothetical protein
MVEILKAGLFLIVSAGGVSSRFRAADRQGAEPSCSLAVAALCRETLAHDASDG